MAALFALAKIQGKNIGFPPETTALGSLVRYVTGSESQPFTPTSFHFGLLPALQGISKKQPKKERQMLLCNRALEDLKGWVHMTGE